MPKRSRAALTTTWHMAEDAWYEQSVKHWKDHVPSETVDGVLGGLGEVDGIDTTGSLEFLKPWLGGRAAPLAGCRALDCGAGIGRVSQGVLLHACERVHCVEVSPALIGRARQALAAQAERLEFTLAPLQSFTPSEHGSYDLIWMQWVLGHLTDSSTLRLLEGCREALREGGAIVVKENNAEPRECKGEGRGKYALDEENWAVIRTHAHYRQLFKAAKLRLVRFERQRGLPSDLYAVRMYLLERAASAG